MPAEQTMRPEGSIGRLMPGLRTVAFAVTILGAIPTGFDLYHSLLESTSLGLVRYNLEQDRLWKKNLPCKVDYKVVTIANNIKVNVGTCPTSGDINFQVADRDGKAATHWMESSQLQVPGQAPPAPSFFQILMGTAQAGEASPKSNGRPVQLAQAPLQVVCQSMQGKQIVRVVNDGGKCFRETFSPRRGIVDKREEVPCDTKCPVAG